MKIKLLKFRNLLKMESYLKIKLHSNIALSLHLEQVKNLLDELAMGKELEEDDPKWIWKLEENTFDNETNREDEAKATLALDEEPAGQTKRNSGSVLLGLGSLHLQWEDDWFVSSVLRQVRPAPADRKWLGWA